MLNQTGRIAFEPSLTAVKLPRCGGCGHPHPLAMKPRPADVTKCPNCGAQVATPEGPVVVDAVLTGKSVDMRVARALHAVGRFLRTLAKRV